MVNTYDKREKKLVIFDCYDTIIMPDNKGWYIPRVNIEEVLKTLLAEDLKLALSTDENEPEGEYNCLDHLGNLSGYFKGNIYRGDRMIYIEEERMFLKPLATICDELDILTGNSIMIGDNRSNIDYMSSKYAGLRFLKIPSSVEDYYFDMKDIFKTDLNGLIP